MKNRETQPPVELQGDPARQAMPLLRGVDYQIWQTVVAWIDLAENEMLVVEGAEDFDVISETKAIGNQVKNLAAPISLRSVCVCEALRNFWTIRHKNPSRQIGLRLITTANLSFEAGFPFGASQLGLEIWNNETTLKSPKHSQLLKEFLVSDVSVSKRLAKPFDDGIPSLIEHLRQLSPDLFHVEFIQRIQWLSKQPDVDVIREMVRVKLRAYGESKNLLARDSERASSSLFEFIAHVAIKEHRVLTRDDFRVQFDEVARISVPVSLFTQMQAAIAVGMQQTSTMPSEVNFSLVEITSIPDLPVPCALRTALVDKLAEPINENGFVAIQGSTGKGKSTLAKLLARKLSGRWLWISFSNWEASRISEGLQHMAMRVAALPHATHLLLDDFNPTGTDSPLLIQKLAVLSRLTLMRGGRMIVTTQQLLGNVFLRQSNLPPQSLQQVTAFRNEEVKELCLQAGCPSDSRLEPWVNIISTQTGQHPQLVHARVKVASRRGWPMPKVTDILEIPQEISDERQLSRKLLQELDDGDIELLYRLSLASMPFRKDQAIAVGETSPPISRAGDKFDSLVGPWIEPAGNQYYRLSFLLNRAAEENWTPERVTAMRVEFGNAIQRTRDRTLNEASEILFQAVLTKNSGLAAPVLVALTRAPTESRKNCAQVLGWMLVLENPRYIFPDYQFVSQLFSLIQFRLAASSDSDSAPKYAEHLFEESIKPIHPDVDAYSVIGGSIDILLAIQVLVAPELLLRCWLNASQLVDQDKRFDKIARSIEAKRPKSGHVFPDQSFNEILFSFILSRRGNSDYLRRFVVAVNDLSVEQRGKIIPAMKANRFRLYGFVDDVWTHELTKEKPDWDNAIAALKEACQAGEQWDIAELCMIAARGIAAIQDEYLKKRDEALKTLADTAIKVGDGLMLRYQRGMVHYLNEENAEAYKVWFSTFGEWPTDSEEAAIYAFNAFSNCGAAAGFMNHWEDAMMAFNKGRDLALKVRRKLDAIRFGVDAAYAQWRANFRKEAIASLAQNLREMEDLSRTEQSSGFHTQWKLMEHIIIWCKSDAGAPHNMEIVTPRPGICSEVKTKEKHDLVKNAPRAPALMSWYCLAEAELYAGLGRNIILALESRSDLSHYPNLRPMIEFLRSRRALADGEFENVPLFAESGALAFSEIDMKNVDERTLLQKFKPASPTANTIPNVASFVEESLLCVLLILSAQDISWEAILDRWSTVSNRMKQPAILTTAIDTIKRICSAIPLEIYHKYAASSSPRFSQMIAGLQLVIHPETKPAMCYVGLCALVTDVGFATNMMFSHDALAILTRKKWLAYLSAPFELNSPRLTVPAIKAACESDKKGLALAANILLAAGDAVSVTKTENIRSQLRKLASA